MMRSNRKDIPSYPIGWKDNPPAAPARARDSPVPSAYALADAVAAAVKLGIPQMTAASLARYVFERNPKLNTGELLAKMMHHRAYPPIQEN